LSTEVLVEIAEVIESTLEGDFHNRILRSQEEIGRPGNP
jgi:hypothetical protein